MLKEALKGVLDDAEILDLSSAFDVIGDIAIVKIPQSLKHREIMIGEQILQKMKNVTTVLSQESDVKGEFRTRELKFIAGEEKYETTYKESGCLFRVNPRSVYFSPRLSTERLRIAGLVRDGERIFNMFAGVGTFSFIIAKNKKCAIDSVDVNPEAIRLAFESLKLNRKMKGAVRPILADAGDFAERHGDTFDRVLMPLPEMSGQFLDAAIKSTKNKGPSTIHYYVHVPLESFKTRRWIEDNLRNAIGAKREYEISNWKRVREVGPRYIQAVADILLK